MGKKLTSGTGRTLSILNFKGTPDLPANYEEEKWTKLQESILAIQQYVPVKCSLEELYKDVEDLCKHNLAKNIYNRLKNLVEDCIQKGIAQCSEFLEDQKFTKKLNECWINYREQMILIRNIFLFLDRKYTVQNPTVLSLWDLWLDIWRKNIKQDEKFLNVLIQNLLSMVHSERTGVIVDRSLLKNLITMLNNLLLYNDFKDRLLTATERFYAQEVSRHIRDMSLSDYLHYVDKCLKQEKDRAILFFDQDTEFNLIHLIEKLLIASHLKQILEKNFDELIDNNRKQDLALLYALFARVEFGLSTLCSFFNGYVKNTGKGLVINPEKDKSMILALLDFKDRMDSIVYTCFRKNQKFIDSLREAFEWFVNQRANKPAELLAKFVDSKLRMGNKEATDEELERLLDKLMVLFRFVHGKDVFEIFYKKDLAKRLLVGKSASFDTEKSMFTKLKQECGDGFTLKLEGMFKDIELSKDINVSFKQHLLHISDPGSIDLTINVLTMGFWPTTPLMEVNLPTEMAQYQSIFNSFYLSKYHGRKLQWQPSLGHCVLKAGFPNGQKELQVSLLQTIVLLMFNNGNELSYEEIRQNTAINETELKTTLQSLACGKARVLLKLPRGRDISNTDQFQYNQQFTNKYCRIKINQVQMKETALEQRNTVREVIQNRQLQIDAAIVRIMKTRKVLGHHTLVNELYQLLKFPLNRAELKKCIESLIDRDYIERDKENPNQYHYVV